MTAHVPVRRRTLSGRLIPREQVNPGWGKPTSARQPTFREKYDALVRLNAAADDPEHLDHGVELADLVKDEMTRRPRKNRTAFRERPFRLNRGSSLPSLSAQRMAVSGAEASVLAESEAVWDVPDDELAGALTELAQA